MANSFISKSTLQQLNSLSRLTFVRQLGFMLIVASAIALGTSVSLWSTTPDYTPVYMNVSTQDAASMVEILEQNGTPYRVNPESGLITVPASQLQQVRLQLANNGLPRNAGRGFSLLDDEQSLTGSSFLEQARYNRALEQELVQTIKLIRGVRDARVHLSIPKQTSFIRSVNQPSASVMVDITSPQALNNQQVMGILHLVASSISDLNPQNVSVVDQYGNLLSGQSDSEFANSNENIRLTRQIEEDYTRRIIDILTPVLGPGNVRAQVSADLDFTIIERTEESYNPNSSVVRSEQTQEERLGSQSSNIPTPGELSVTPPADNAQAQQTQESSDNQTRINATRNYEIDRTVSLVRTIPGAINRLSVAVVVDLAAAGIAVDDPASTQAQIDRLTQVVRDSIGFNQLRGDSVNVLNEAFLPLTETLQAGEMPIWQQAWIIPLLKQLGAAVVVFLLIFSVLRPALKSVVTSTPLATTAESSSDNRTALSAPGGSAASLPSPGNNQQFSFEHNLNLAQEVVRNEPAKAARMIQNWLTND